ncbi:hypothetical protein CAI21_15275 [Alkalilimnicola ehrlichii]|uniref:Histidine kinase VP0354-like sensor domain-containing protein n=1 Tax=Alkalilimnicola ehrlichii TaxID=351052 RepID=A0A3E0WQZ0_9GAMM|nr:cache domain-containing protein [Alkalilimnicola ehrlichii]RFA27207.1 hypothetical protein CAI21_15275 [Alkalilimnicola ehrlichii]RFA35380.1 hypothetical protein CAL65_12940 [Alkalilimnicola ehrlichii]
MTSNRTKRNTDGGAKQRQGLRLGYVVRSIATFAILGGFTFAVLLFLDHERYTAQLETTLSEEVERLDSVTDLLRADMSWIASRTRILADSPHIANLIEAPTRINVQQLEQELLDLARYIGVFETIRLVDPGGVVRIQVNYHNGDPYLIPEPPLANLSGYAFFDDTLALEGQEVYLSPLDVDRFHGRSPQIHLGTQVTDADGELAVILLLSYSAEILLSRLQLAAAGPYGAVFIVNMDGSALTPAEEVNAGTTASALIPFSDVYPVAWSVIEHRENGYVETPRGYFAFTTLAIDELNDRGLLTPSGLDRHWKMVNVFPHELYRYAPFQTTDLTSPIAPDY